MAEQLTTLADLAEDWWAVPASTSSVSQLPVIPTPGNLMPSSGVHSTDVVCTTPPTPLARTHVCTHTCIVLKYKYNPYKKTRMPKSKCSHLSERILIYVPYIVFNISSPS